MKHLLLVILLSMIAHNSIAAFEENHRRYLSSSDVFRSIQSIFGYEGRTLCLDYEYASAHLSLGDNNVATGEPAISNPNSATVGQVTKCFSLLFSRVGNTEPLVKRDQISNFLMGFSTLSPKSEQTALLNPATSWREIPAEQRKLIIQRLTYRVLGSDERIKDFAIVQDPNEIRDQLFDSLETEAHGKSNLTQAVSVILLSLILRDEFLSY